MQSSDDPGRELDGIWLGPPNVRWPVDWSWKKWGLFAIVLIGSFPLLALLVPLGVIVLAAAWWSAGVMAPTLDRDRPARWRWALLGALLFIGFVLLPHPRAWLLPVWLPLVFVLSPVCAVLAVRMYGRFLTWNTPLGYWARLPRLVASGPRLRVSRPIDPGRLALDGGTWTADRNLSPAPAADVLPDFQPVEAPEVIEPENGADNGGWRVAAIGFDTIPGPAAIALTNDMVTTIALETFPMPPARHPFVKRIPGGLYFHRLNYKIEWGPR